MQQGILFLIDLAQCMYVCMSPRLIMGLVPSINVMHAANVCESLQWTVTALLFLCIYLCSCIFLTCSCTMYCCT